MDAAGEPATVITAEGAAVVSVSPVPNGEEVRGYLPVGEYTLEETVDGSWNLTLTVNGETEGDLTFTGESGRGYMLAAGNAKAFAINLEASEHGSVAVTGDEVSTENDSIKAYAGFDVTLTVTPEEGCCLENLTVTYTDENGENLTVETTEGGTNTYIFEMPWYDVTVTAVFSECGHEKYINGFCERCGAYEPAELNNDVYEISNVGQYCWFAQQVGSGNNYINGKLLADIDISGDRFAGDAGVMIGTVYENFSGIFDGNGHTLTVKLSAQGDCVGPFLFIHGATIRNLTVKGTVTTSAYFASGLVASTIGDCIIENCVSDVTIISTKVGDRTHGGLVGFCQGGTLAVTNCAFRGKIDGPSTTCCGGMVGWADGVATFKNCHVAGTFVMDDTTGSDTFARNAVNLAFENCYYLNEFGATNIGPVQKSAAQFTSGEVSYLLGADWGQTIGTESYPVPGGETVYQVKDCDGESIVYSNKNENVGHTLENCACTVCGTKEHQEAAGYDENGFCKTAAMSLPWRTMAFTKSGTPVSSTGSCSR